MPSEEIIPQDYQQWRDCITIRCGLVLTAEYIEQRLHELKRSDHPNTKEFTKLYGAEHLQRTVFWFEQAANEATPKVKGKRHA